MNGVGATSHRGEAGREGGTTLFKSMSLTVVGALGLVALLAGPVLAEGTEKRDGTRSDKARVRGVSGLTHTSSGFLGVGSARLRYLPHGGKRWKTLHQVKGDNLYRVDERDGRVLAAWEGEPVFHLFDLSSGKHTTIAKPARPTGITGLQDFRLTELLFSDNGKDAIVYMWAPLYESHTGSRKMLSGYRIPLDGKRPAVLLFRQEGAALDMTTRGAVIVVPTSWRFGCSHSGCSVDQIVAYEIRGDRAKRRTLFDGKGQRYDSAQIVPSAQKYGIAVQVTGSPDPPGKRNPTLTRDLLRYSYGNEPTVQRLPDWHTPKTEHLVLDKDGNFYEATQAEDKSVTITRHTPDGKVSKRTIQSWADRRGRPAKAWMTRLSVRTNGQLWMHWGDYIVVVDEAGARRFDVQRYLGRGTEWANAFMYVEKPEQLWIGIEVGGGRDYVRVGFDVVDRKARPWKPPSASPGDRDPLPPAVAKRLKGRRVERAVGGGVLSIGRTDLYFRTNRKDPWRLLYAVPNRSIYRMQIDEASGRILAHWSSERQVHLFVPGADEHRTFPWPESDVEGFNEGLQGVFFDPDGRHALIHMSGLVRGSGQGLNEAYRVPLDGKGPAKRLFRVKGKRLHLSERGATFALPSKSSGHCNVRRCVIDCVFVVDIDGDRAKTRVVYRKKTYTDYVGAVSGSTPDALGVVVKYSKGRSSERSLLRFRYGARGVKTTVLTPYTLEAVKKSYLTREGDYLEFIVDEHGDMTIELFRDGQPPTSWKLRGLAHKDIDSTADKAVYGFGQRKDGSYWLHWGDHIVLLATDGTPRTLDIAKRIKRTDEWAGADRYTADPETLTIGVDYNAGRRFIDLPFTAIEKRAKRRR